MEVVGVVASAITLASVFKNCLEAFDVIKLYQNHDADFQGLILLLNIERCRLYVWGQSMRLTSGSARTALDDCPFIDVVSGCLRRIRAIFDDSEKIREKYGCEEMVDGTRSMEARQQSRDVRILAAAFANFRIRDKRKLKKEAPRDEPQPSQTPAMRKTQWAIQDRKKFQLLIEEVKSLIDGLQEITKDLCSSAKQDEKMSSRIMNIRDAGTLTMVANVCETSHPRIAYAASTRAESISMVTSKRNAIARWQSEIESEKSDGTSVAHLEDLTVTELKYQISRLLRDRLAQGDSQIAKPTDSVAAAGTTIESLQETVTGLERERDFYFSKLRDIELLIQSEQEQNPKLAEDVDNWTVPVLAILYAVEDGFEPPDEADDDNKTEDGN